MINLAQNGYTHDQVVDILCAAEGTRHISYRLDVLRNGSKVAELDNQQTNYQCNYESEVKYYSLAYVNDNPMVEWRTDYLRPLMILHYRGQDFTYPFRKLKFVTVTDQIRNGVAGKRVEAYDETVVLQDNSIGYSLSIPKGTLYTVAVGQLIASAGVTNVNIVPSTKPITSDREDWSMSDSILTVSNELLSEINYRTLEVDSSGLITSYEYKSPSVADVQIKYRADNKSIILYDKEVEYDSYKKPNYIIGYVSNPELEEPMRYEFPIDSPSSPLSPQNNGGYTYREVVEFKDVADYEVLVAKVQQIAEEYEQQYELATLSTAIMPHHEAREVISVESNGVKGIYMETGWVIDKLSHDGKMTHTLRKVVYD